MCDLSEMNFVYSIDCDYHRNYSNCQCGDYCRCSTLEGVEITSIDLESITDHIVRGILSLTWNAKIDQLDPVWYGVHRILTHYKYYDKESWEVCVAQGYYGEEIGSISMSNATEIQKTLNEFIKLKKLRTQMEFLLRLEYTNLLDSLVDKEWSIKTVERDVILIPNNERIKTVEANGAKEIYGGYPSFRAVCLVKGNQFCVVDGYTRMSAWTTGPVPIICAK